MATARFLRSFAWLGAITLALVVVCYGQSVKPNEVIKWDDYVPHYLDGAAWKPMTVVVSAARETGVSMKEGLKNPVESNAGRTRIAMYKDPSALITLGASPKFCIAIPTNVNTEVLPPGEYILGGPPTIGIYDFGVELNKAN